MAIQQGMAIVAKLAVLNGNFSGTDTFKIALYADSASYINPTVVSYSAISESVGAGYVAGGLTLTGFTSSISASVADISWNSPTIPTASLTSRCALIYDVTRNNLAIAVVDFGADFTSTSGSFTINIPSTGLIQLT